MVKRMLLILGCGLFLGGCSLIPKKSGLEVISYPVAKVYVDNKEVGMTPYKNSGLKPGTIEVKLKTNDQEWSKKVELQNNINTVVDWEFGTDKESSGGYVLFLEKTGDDKKAGLMVNATPDKSAISIDNQIKGRTPQRFNDIGQGDKQLTLSFPSHKNLNVFVKAINGYQLIIDAILAEEKTDEDTASTDIQPTPSVANTKSVVIKETETGWLRVRDQANNAGEEVAKVKPKEIYPLLEEAAEWYKIDLGNDKSGWVSTKYVEKVE